MKNISFYEISHPVVGSVLTNLEAGLAEYLKTRRGTCASAS